MPAACHLTRPEAVAPEHPLGRYSTPSCALCPLGAGVLRGAPIGWLAIRTHRISTKTGRLDTCAGVLEMGLQA
jgi:hypothetical protein